jgi:hypothetical protein
MKRSYFVRSISIGLLIIFVQATAALFLAVAFSSRAGSFSANFDSGALPPGSHTNGSASLETTGGVGNSGCLKLTKYTNSPSVGTGSLILNDLDPGRRIYGFDVTFNLRVGGGVGPPGSGFSLALSPSLDDNSTFGEFGPAINQLSFDWEFDDQYGLPAPRIAVRESIGVLFAEKAWSIDEITTTGDVTTWWAPVHIRLNADGLLDLEYKGQNVFSNMFVPNYPTILYQGLRFGLGAEASGTNLNANQWIDNLQITTFTNPLVGISQQPISQTAQRGDDIKFDVRLGNPSIAALQWYSNNVARAGANSQTLTVSNVQPSFSGSQYYVIATGPNNAVTSSVVTLGVTDIAPPASPQLSFNFDDGRVPTGTTLSGFSVYTGTPVIIASNGVGNSGCLLLTDGSDNSSIFTVLDPAAGAPVYGFTARFKTLFLSNNGTGSDGFAFIFGNDTNLYGTNLQVVFNFFDTLGLGLQQPCSIAVGFGGQLLKTIQLPISFMETPTYKDTIIQLHTDGTLDVVYNGALVLSHLVVPGFRSIAAGRFALAANTGSGEDWVPGITSHMTVDNFQLTAVIAPGQPLVRAERITGSGLRLTWSGGGFKLQSTSSLTAPVAWTDLPGAVSGYVAPLTGPSQYFRLAAAQ